MRAALTAAVCCVNLLAIATNVLADDWFPLRNQNPFLQIYGLPAFDGTAVLGKANSQFRFSLDVVNHADLGSTQDEAIVIDGESYYLDLVYRRGVSDRLELGFVVPLMTHRGGYLDNTIESWHDFLGLSNSKREGPSNQLFFSYEKQNVIDFSLDSPAVGFGDVRLTAAVPLRTAATPGELALTVRSVLKLPTGEADELTGSGAVDFAVSLHASIDRVAGLETIGLSGFAGVLWCGDSEVFSAIQEAVVPFAGGAANWQIAPRLSVLGQLYVQGRFYDSALDELAGRSVQFALGAGYRLEKTGLLLTLGIVEDIVGDTTPDFALHFSIRNTPGGRVRP